MTSHRSRLTIGAGLAALILCSATVGAGAAGLIGSKDIRDDSIKSVDIKNGTIAGRDVKDGALTGDDVAGGLQVRSGADRVVTWSGSYIADGSMGGDDVPLLTSSDTVPANSLVRGLDLDVTGAAPCTDGLSVDVRVPSPAGSDEIRRFASITRYPTANRAYAAYDDVMTSQSSDAPAELFVSCNEGDPVPSFDFTATFTITQLATAPTGTFQ